MRNPWGIPTEVLEEAGSPDELLPHAMLEKAMKEAVDRLELAQHANTNAPHTKLLAWEALDILRTALRRK
jgi:hypothetical protein